MSAVRTPTWFEVDKAGLAAMLDRRGRAVVILELLQNAWDAPGVQNVRATLKGVNGTTAELLVIDDSPEGFVNLSHAFTLFAASHKKADPTLRGRFNLGEKMVLSLCKSASIVSRTGGVAFGADGSRHETFTSAAKLRSNPHIGTTFHAMIEMTKDDIEDVERRVRTLFPPVNTTFNGIQLRPRSPVCPGESVNLFTEVADESGTLRRRLRETTMTLYPVLEGESASIYEMGIPICETGDEWHVDISQRVPMGIERDSVTPGYLQSVRAYALNIAAKYRVLDRRNAAAPWVDDALASNITTPASAKGVVQERFGSKAVIFDLSDREANKRAVAAGYAVIHGGAFSGEAWQTIKNAGVLSAGKVTPSPQPYSEDGKPLVAYPVDQWTPGIHAVVWLAKTMASEVLKRTCERDGPSISVKVVNDAQWRFSATYGPGELTINVGTLGKAWFAAARTNPVSVFDLLIHEFGHHYEGDHLSDAYYKALSLIGARTAVWLACQPRVLNEFCDMVAEAVV